MAGRRASLSTASGWYRAVMPGLESPWHWLVLLVVLLLLFGSKKLPEMGRSVGKGIREFKDSVSGLSLDADDKTPPQSPAALMPPAPAVRDTDTTAKERDTLSS